MEENRNDNGFNNDYNNNYNNDYNQDGFYQNEYNQDEYNQDGYYQDDYVEYVDAEQYREEDIPYYNNSYSEDKVNALAIVSLVLGIGSIVADFFIAGVGTTLGIVGLVLGVQSKKNSHQSGMATAGFVLSIVGIVLSGLKFMFALCFFSTIIGAMAL